MVYTVRMEPPSDEGKKYAEEKGYRKDQIDAARRLNTISVWGACIAGAALLALIINGWLIYQSNTINKSSSELAYRPYIGVNGMSVNYGYQSTPDGPVVYRGATRDAPTNLFTFSVEIKNFGPVPGKNASNRWRIFIGDEEQPQHAIPDTPFMFFPGQTVGLEGRIGIAHYPSIISGDKTLTVEVTTEYDGPTGHDKQCVKEQFSPAANAFLTLGACTH
jgi:hypothetical protein